MYKDDFSKKLFEKYAHALALTIPSTLLSKSLFQRKRKNILLILLTIAAYNTPVHGAVWVGAVLHAVIMVYGWFYMLLYVCFMGVIGVEW